MSTNDEMARIMAAEGFSADRQRFLRGGASPHQEKYWLAVKESQNLVLADDRTFVLWMNSRDGSPYTRRWKTSLPGSSRITVWMKRSKKNPRKLWTRLGEYTFGEIIRETHCVKKRGKPYYTDIARVATPVVNSVEQLSEETRQDDCETSSLIVEDESSVDMMRQEMESQEWEADEVRKACYARASLDGLTKEGIDHLYMQDWMITLGGWTHDYDSAKRFFIVHDEIMPAFEQSDVTWENVLDSAFPLGQPELQKMGLKQPACDIVLTALNLMRTHQQKIDALRNDPNCSNEQLFLLEQQQPYKPKSLA